MKVKRPELERALDKADPRIRLYLLHGPDESTSRALAGRLGAALGPDDERIDLSGPALKSDPARLADEAASLSLFGGQRWIRVDPAGDEALAAIEALLESEVAANPVAVIAATLRGDAKLVKLANAHPAAMAYAAYVPEGREAAQLAVDLGRDAGLTVSRDVGARLAAAANGDRATIAQEIAKYADYLDAGPDRPQPLEHALIDLIGADGEDGDIAELIDLALAGDVAATEAGLGRFGDGGIDAVPAIRALQRRLLLLAELRSRIDAGSTVETAMASARALFWKDKQRVERQLGRWRSDALAALLSQVATDGRASMSATAPGSVAIAGALLSIARTAARRSA